jgi:FKBP-type peptidyl-prolyl cis-trans isomerase FkpA
MAQTPPASNPATPTKAAAAPAKKAAATPAKSATGAPPPTGTAAPKPAATGATPAGRGATGAGRGAAAPKPAVAVKPLATDDEKTVYALGLSIGQSLAMFNLTPAEIDIVKRAITDAANKKPEVELSEWGPKIDPLARSRASAVAEKQKASSVAYLAKCAAEPGAVKARAIRPRPPTP